MQVTVTHDGGTSTVTDVTGGFIEHGRLLFHKNGEVRAGFAEGTWTAFVSSADAPEAPTVKHDVGEVLDVDALVALPVGHCVRDGDGDTWRKVGLNKFDLDGGENHYQGRTAESIENFGEFTYVGGPQ